MKGRISGIGLVVAVVVAACLLPSAYAAVRSNGIEGKTATQIVAAAIAAGASAKTVHVSASTVGLSFDLQIVAGKGGKGRLAQSGVSFDFVRIGKNAYFRGSDKFWRKYAGSAGVQLFHGRWMRAPATKGDLASFTPLTDLKALMTQAIGSHGKLAKGRTLTFHGQHVVAVQDVTKGGTLYVATDGKPYPVAIKSGKQGGILFFDRWNASVTLAAPKNSIDFTKLHK